MRACLATVVLLLAGCFPCPQPRALTAPDGGAIACTRNQDCPTENATLVCTQTQDRLYECIGCEVNRCVRFVPEACR